MPPRAAYPQGWLLVPGSRFEGTRLSKPGKFRGHRYGAPDREARSACTLFLEGPLFMEGQVVTPPRHRFLGTSGPGRKKPHRIGGRRVVLAFSTVTPSSFGGAYAPPRCFGAPRFDSCHPCLRAFEPFLFGQGSESGHALPFKGPV